MQKCLGRNGHHEVTGHICTMIGLQQTREKEHTLPRADLHGNLTDEYAGLKLHLKEVWLAFYSADHKGVNIWCIRIKMSTYLKAF